MCQNLILPGPSDIEDELNFNAPFFVENYLSSMDTLQLKMINQSNVQKFINTIISLQNSYDLNDDGTYRVCEKEMSIIREMKHMRSEGIKLQTIADKLTNKHRKKFFVSWVHTLLNREDINDMVKLEVQSV